MTYQLASTFSQMNTLGFRVVTSPEMADRRQVLFPRSKKRRIRRKWAKQDGNYVYVPWQKAYRVGNTFHMHPGLYERLKREVTARGDCLVHT